MAISHRPPSANEVRVREVGKCFRKSRRVRDTWRCKERECSYHRWEKLLLKHLDYVCIIFTDGDSASLFVHLKIDCYSTGTTLEHMNSDLDNLLLHCLSVKDKLGKMSVPIFPHIFNRLDNQSENGLLCCMMYIPPIPLHTRDITVYIETTCLIPYCVFTQRCFSLLFMVSGTFRGTFLLFYATHYFLLSKEYTFPYLHDIDGILFWGL